MAFKKDILVLGDAMVDTFWVIDGFASWEHTYEGGAAYTAECLRDLAGKDRVHTYFGPTVQVNTRYLNKNWDIECESKYLDLEDPPHETPGPMPDIGECYIAVISDYGKNHLSYQGEAAKCIAKAKPTTIILDSKRWSFEPELLRILEIPIIIRCTGKELDLLYADRMNAYTVVHTDGPNDIVLYRKNLYTGKWESQKIVRRSVWEKLHSKIRPPMKKTTIGCGDLFTAAFAYFLTKRADLYDACEFADKICQTKIKSKGFATSYLPSDELD